MQERRTEGRSLFRTRIGPIISASGGALAVMALWLPLFFISPPLDPTSSNLYPPVTNGWQAIGLLQAYPSDTLATVAPDILLWLLLGVIMLSSSLLAFFHQGSLLAALVRPLAASASLALLCDFALASVFLNWGWSPDQSAAFQAIDVGPALWLLLVSAALSALGAGRVSMGALVGTFCGIFIGNFVPLLVHLPYNFEPLTGIVLGNVFLALALLGCFLGGWRFLRKQARLHRVRAASHRMHNEQQAR